MAVYVYQAKDKTGKKSVGLLEAPSDTQVVKVLRAHSLLPIQIQLKSKVGLLPALFARVDKIKVAELATFTHQMSAMISAGVPLTESLASLAQQTKNKKLRKALESIVKDVEGGSTLAAAMTRYPNIFNNLYASLVRSGETGGVLDKVLDRLAQNLTKQAEFISKTKGALLYPAIVVTLLIGVVVIIMVFVIPRLSLVYADIGIDLPLPTRIVLAISKAMTRFWFFIPLLILGFLIIIRLLKRSDRLMQKVDELTLQIPIWGQLQRAIILTNFSRTLALMVGGGIPILDALRVVREVVANVAFTKTLDQVSAQVERGIPIYQTITKSKMFPPLVSEMIRVGEETGKLDEVLDKLAIFYEAESEQLIRNLTTALEPIIIIVIGAGVGFVILSVILPIYKLATAI